MRISKEQIKFMESYKKKSIVISSLNEDELSMLKYLVSRKFIKEKDTDENFKAELSDKEYCLTEEGKAYLSEYNYTYIQWILTTCLAVLALIVSIISLVITSLNS